MDSSLSTFLDSGDNYCNRNPDYLRYPIQGLQGADVGATLAQDNEGPKLHGEVVYDSVHEHPYCAADF